MYETESVITMLLGLWMVNVVFALGHRLLNFKSSRVTYFVNASLFIYLVHHPLTLFFGAYITPHIASNTLGFFTGLVFVVGIAIVLYEIHLRIPLLRFLFSGKPQVKPHKPRRTQCAAFASGVQFLPALGQQPLIKMGGFFIETDKDTFSGIGFSDR
jgi:hypothetical protein